MKYYIIAIAFFLCSCSASKKVVTESKSTKDNDSTSIKKEEVTKVVDSGFVKKESVQQNQIINLEYEPSMTDKNDYVEINLNGNTVKVPTKGLRKLNTKQKDRHESFDSSSVGIIEHSKIDDSTVTHTKETASNKSTTEKKGWIADLFGGAVTKIVYIVAAFIIICIIIFIIVLIRKRNAKRKLIQKGR